MGNWRKFFPKKNIRSLQEMVQSDGEKQHLRCILEHFSTYCTKKPRPNPLWWWEMVSQSFSFQGVKMMVFGFFYIWHIFSLPASPTKIIFSMIYSKNHRLSHGQNESCVHAFNRSVRGHFFFGKLTVIFFLGTLLYPQHYNVCGACPIILKRARWWLENRLLALCGWLLRKNRVF